MMKALAALRRFVTKAERCDLCAAPLAPEHAHLAEPAARRLLCCCDSCSLLLGQGESKRYRTVSPRVEAVEVRLDDETWQRLGVPVGLAFFYLSTTAGGILASLPSPGGALETAVDPEAWAELIERNARLAELRPDVEALLVNRTAGNADCLTVSIDHAYKLVGLVRSAWEGMSGGPGVIEAVRCFFDDLKVRAVAPRP